jgi:DNA-binding NarL/FixJ family response regulator
MSKPTFVFAPECNLNSHTVHGRPPLDHPAANFLGAEDWERIADRARLTPRELSVAIFIFEGKTRYQIARALKCAAGTVRVYIDRLFAKLRVQDRVGLVLRLVRIHLEIAAAGKGLP